MSPEEPVTQDPFDARAFHAFAKEQYGRAADWARVLHVEEDVAEEALQAAMIALWEKRALVPRSRWAGWLPLAAVFCKSKLLRRETRIRKREALLTFAFFEQLLAPSPEAELRRAHCQREALWLVEQVKPGRRDVVRLHLLEEVPLPDVANALGIPLGTAKTRYRAGLEDMRKAYAREDAGEDSLLIVARLAAAAAAMFAAVWARLGSLFAGARARVASLLGRRGSATEARSSLGSAQRELRPASGRAGRAPVLAATAVLLVLALGALTHDPLRGLDVDAVHLAPVHGLVAASTAATGPGVESIASAQALAPPPEPPSIADVAPVAAPARPVAPVTQRAAPVAPVARRAARTASAPRDNRVASPAASVATVASVDSATSTKPPPLDYDPNEALPLLFRAAAAIHDGEVDIARAALNLYVAAYPENPFPEKYAVLKRQVSP